MGSTKLYCQWLSGSFHASMAGMNRQVAEARDVAVDPLIAPLGVCTLAETSSQEYGSAATIE